MAQSRSLKVKIPTFIFIFILSYLGIAHGGLITVEAVKDFTKPTISVAHEGDPRFETFGQKRLTDVSRDFSIPMDVLIQGLGLPDDVDPDTILKDLEEYGVSPMDVEAFIVEGGYDRAPVPEEVLDEPVETATLEDDPRFTKLGQKSLATVSEEFGIPMEELLSDLGLPMDMDPDTILKDLSEYGKTVPEIKAYLEEKVQEVE
jgi:hypothetical protein